MIVWLLYPIFPEASRYSSMRRNVWYWICFGRLFQSCLLLGYVFDFRIAFSTFMTVRRFGSCSTFFPSIVHSPRENYLVCYINMYIIHSYTIIQISQSSARQKRGPYRSLYFTNRGVESDQTLFEASSNSQVTVYTEARFPSR